MSHVEAVLTINTFGENVDVLFLLDEMEIGARHINCNSPQTRRYSLPAQSATGLLQMLVRSAQEKPYCVYECYLKRVEEVEGERAEAY